MINVKKTDDDIIEMHQIIESIETENSEVYTDQNITLRQQKMIICH